jgi:hypothetical protein
VAARLALRDLPGVRPRLAEVDRDLPIWGDARRWLDELLIDHAQTIESLAMREHNRERSIRMTVSLAFVSPVLAEAAPEGLRPFCDDCSSLSV